MTDFKQWMLDNYSHNKLADIANHGCSGGVGGMIYYTETTELYKLFDKDLHELLADYKDATGEMPQSIIQALTENAQSFQNCMVWFAAEWVANEVTQGEYIQETEEQ